MNKTSEDCFKKYTSHFIVRFACERELETEQNCHILTPTLMDISVVSFSFSRAAQPDAQKPTQSGVPRAPSAGGWLSLPNFVSDFSSPTH